MDKIQEYLDINLITIAEHNITVGQVLIVPATILFGFFLIRWLGRMLNTRLTTRGVNPDVVQLISRAFYIIGLAILVITTLDLINVPLTA